MNTLSVPTHTPAALVAIAHSDNTWIRTVTVYVNLRALIFKSVDTRIDVAITQKSD